MEKKLNEMTHKELQEKIMELPKLEVLEDELIHKRMNDINTFQAHENEVYLRGTDEYGKDFQICFDSYNFLEWIDTEHLKYIKKQLIKHIKSR
jgi:acyl-ACP thioesterase